MGSGSSGGGGTTTSSGTTTATIAPQLQPLFSNAANEMQTAEQLYPLTGSATLPGTAAPTQAASTPVSAAPGTTTDTTQSLGTPYVAPAAATPALTAGQPATAATSTAAPGAPNYFAPNPMQIAPQNTLQTTAQNLTPDLLTAGTGALNQAQTYASLAPEIAGTMAAPVTADNPMMQATQQAFNQTMSPLIENQLSLAGLGDSSTLGNSLALADISQLVPTQQYEQSQEQNVIEAMASTMSGLVPGLTNLGNSEQSQLNTAITGMSTAGAAEQAAAQQPLTSAYQDYLRTQALAEEALFVPFGDLVPSGAIGSATTGATTSNPSSTGLFK